MNLKTMDEAIKILSEAQELMATRGCNLPGNDPQGSVSCSTASCAHFVAGDIKGRWSLKAARYRVTKPYCDMGYNGGEGE